QYKWATEDELLDYYAIGQCTPGIIAVNTATFVGYKQCGIIGASIATLGIITPSIIIILAIAGVLQQFSSILWVQHAFAGIRVAVAALIISSIVKLWKNAVVDAPTFIIFALVFLLSLLLPVSPVFFVIGAAAAGIVIKKIRGELK
ncbi:MAG: chromate transporter, partial [Angelakisella sp.]